MQKRIQTIGQRLVPAAVQNVPDSDPAKLHFKFEVTDTRELRSGLYALSSGVISGLA